MRKRLFYDIETSYTKGFFWRAGYNQTILPNQILEYPKIICISWKWEGVDKVYNLDWGLNKQCDKKLLKKFIEVLNKSDEIVAHNGKRFDIKWIRARALAHGLDMRFKYNEIDTLSICKSQFNLPNNKLSEVAKYLGCTAKLDPGGMRTWVDIIEYKDRVALDRMIEYCNGDVITLEEVFNKLRPYAKNSINYSVLRGNEKFHCPECSSLSYHNKMYTTSAGTIQHYMKCKDVNCKTTFRINNKTYQDFIQYKLVNNIK